MDQLLQNIQDIKRRIDSAARASGRSGDDIILIAVSKTVDLDDVEQAIENGLQDFGENRSRELARKQERFPQARWHMIGQLQTNKVKEVVGKTKLIHSLDRWSLAEALDREAARQRVIVDALVEVNIAGEEQKGGLEPEEVKPFLEAASRLQHLRILGFMAMAPVNDDPETSRPVFRALHNLFTAYQQNPPGGNVNMQYLSMGMSQDFEVAVQEGANIVRVGTAIFAK